MDRRRIILTSRGPRLNLLPELYYRWLGANQMESFGTVEIIFFVFALVFIIFWFGLFFNIIFAILRAYKTVPRELEKISQSLDRIANNLDQNMRR